MTKEFTILVVAETEDEAVAVHMAETFQRVGMGFVLGDGASVGVKMTVDDDEDEDGDDEVVLPGGFTPGSIRFD